MVAKKKAKKAVKKPAKKAVKKAVKKVAKKAVKKAVRKKGCQEVARPRGFGRARRSGFDSSKIADDEKEAPGTADRAFLFLATVHGP